jgi:LPS sulfotransferase NodH
VSLWRALQSRSWRHGSPGDGRPEPQYRFEGIHHLVRRLESEDRGWLDFFSEHGLEPLAISYEDDLERDPDGTIRRALSGIGVQPPGGARPDSRCGVNPTRSPKSGALSIIGMSPPRRAH